MGALADLRTRAAQALAPINGDPWDVHALPVDSIVPPAYMLTWSEPWLAPATHCTTTARLDVMAIANRIDLEPGVELLEDLAENAITKLKAAGLPAVTASQMVRFEIGGVIYLASRLTIVQLVTL